MNHSVLLIWLMLAHWWADFYFQSNWMAQNKSESFKALTLHVLTYAFVVTTFMFLGEAAMFLGEAATVMLGGLQRGFEGKALTEWVQTRAINPVNYLWFLGANFVLHWMTDYVTSRISSYYRDRGNRRAFFNTIGFDQYIHFVCLWLTSAIWLVPMNQG